MELRAATDLLLGAWCCTGQFRLPLLPLYMRLSSWLGLRLRCLVIAEARQLLAVQARDETSSKARNRAREPGLLRSTHLTRAVVPNPRRLLPWRQCGSLGLRRRQRPRGGLRLLRSCRTHAGPLLLARRRPRHMVRLHDRSRLLQLLLLWCLAVLRHSCGVLDSAKCRRSCLLPRTRRTAERPDAAQKLP